MTHVAACINASAHRRERHTGQTRWLLGCMSEFPAVEQRGHMGFWCDEKVDGHVARRLTCASSPDRNRQSELI